MLFLGLKVYENRLRNRGNIFFRILSMRWSPRPPEAHHLSEHWFNNPPTWCLVLPVSFFLGGADEVAGV